MLAPEAFCPTNTSARHVSPGGLSFVQMIGLRLQKRRALTSVLTFSFSAFDLHQYDCEPPPEPLVRIHTLPCAARVLISFETMNSTCATSLESESSSTSKPWKRIAPS